MAREAAAHAFEDNSGVHCHAMNFRRTTVGFPFSSLASLGFPSMLVVGFAAASCAQSVSSAAGAGGTHGQGGAYSAGGARASGTSASGASSVSAQTGAGGRPTGGTHGSGGGQAAGGGSLSSGGSLGGSSSTSWGGGASTSIGSTWSQGGGSTVVTRTEGPRPADAGSCGAWALTEGVCCAQYCSDDNESEDCSKCGGPGAAGCEVVNAKACTSGQWPEVHSVTANEDWHYSRSTHFGTASTGACAFGLYGLCSANIKLADSALQAQCDTFCTAYPDLCTDPSDITLRGNFAAPQGNYYTQFWSSLPGDLDNYLSCGECFELERTQDDGTELHPSSSGYTSPIVMQVADSCPCSANSKWCCGSGRDHCGEVEGTFKYGCPLPPIPAPPVDHDPQTDESIHFDLDDIAMARLQTGDPNGTMSAGVVPTKYKRVPCPVVGNIHIWLRPNASAYYFALTVVNVAGLGAAAKVEAQLPSGGWVALERDGNYSLSRPQERYGTWALPQGQGPFQLPITLRITDGSGRAVVANGAITAWAPSDSSQAQTWFIDLGVQF